jgi:mRNA interferase YafQ
MRTIKYTVQFRRDYKREKKSGRYPKLDNIFRSIVEKLATDKSLPANKRDHALTGNWTNHRDCHIKPDLVLIYRKPNNKILELVRLGSHNALSL